MGLLKPAPKRLERLPGLTVPNRPRRALWRPGLFVPQSPYIIPVRHLPERATLPTFGAVSTIASASGSAGGVVGDIDLNYPSGISADDLLIACIYSIDAAGGSSAIEGPSGWSVGPQLGSGGLAQIASFYTTATGSESGTIAAIAGWSVGTATAKAVGQIARYSGVDVSGTPYEASGTNSSATGNPAPASITTTGVDRLAICLIGVASNRTIAAISGATGGTWSESAAEQAHSSGNPVMDFQHAALASAGTLSGGTATLSSSSAWRCLTMALKSPAAASVPPRIVNVGQAVNRASRY